VYQDYIATAPTRKLGRTPFALTRPSGRADVVEGREPAVSAIAERPEETPLDRGELTHAQVEELGERAAQELLGVSLAEALARLDRGELAGTRAEDVFTSLRWLLAA